MLAFGFFMGTLIWIGADLYRVQVARREIAIQINEAHRMQEAGWHLAALDELGEARDRWLGLEGTPAALLLEKGAPSQFNFADLFAAAHRDAGQFFTEHQQPAEAEKHYVLALSHDPEMQGVAGRLLTECFYTRNLELGWISGRMVREEKGAPFATRLVQFFEENYKGPRPGE